MYALLVSLQVFSDLQLNEKASAQREGLVAIRDVCFRDRYGDAHLYIVPGDFDLVGARVPEGDGVPLVFSGELCKVILLDNVTGVTVDDSDYEIGLWVWIGLGDGDEFLVSVVAVYLF